MLHLFFGGFALADDGLFDLQGGVFVHGQAAHDEGGDGRAARLAEHEGGGGVGVDEHFFHGGLLRAVAVDDFGEVFHDDADAAGQFVAGDGFDAAGGDVVVFAADKVDDAEAGGAAAGVDAEDAQGFVIHLVFPYRPTGRRCTRARFLRFWAGV